MKDLQFPISPDYSPPFNATLAYSIYKGEQPPQICDFPINPTDFHLLISLELVCILPGLCTPFLWTMLRVLGCV